MLKIKSKYKYLIPELFAFKKDIFEEEAPPDEAKPEAPAKKRGFLQGPVQNFSAFELWTLNTGRSAINSLTTDRSKLSKDNILKSTETGEN